MYYLSDTAMQLLKKDIQVILNSCAHHRTSEKDFDFVKSSDFVADSQVDPHKFFHFQWQNKYCYIHRLKLLNKYSIYCYNFYPRNLASYLPNSDVDLYRNSYGIFDNFSDALSAYAGVVKNLLDFCTSVDYEFYQLELY